MADVATLIEQDTGGRARRARGDAPAPRPSSRLRRRRGAAHHEELEPKLVLRPWTEDPDLPATPTAGRPPGAPHERSRRGVARRAGGAVDAARRRGAHRADAGRSARSGSRLDDDSAPPTTSCKNAEAVALLDELSHDGRRASTLRGHGCRHRRRVPGARVHGARPATVEQDPRDRRSSARNDPEYWLTRWTLAARGGHPPPRPGRRAARRSSTARSGRAGWWSGSPTSARTRAARHRARRSTTRSTTPASSCCSRSASSRLLFPGDAQIENWRYTLDDCAATRRSATARRRRPLQGRPPRQPQRDPALAPRPVEGAAATDLPRLTALLSTRQGSTASATTPCRRRSW